MRHFFIASGILVAAVSSFAQTAQTAPQPNVETSAATAPPLTKTVAVEPTDSPLVRAAKLAVASRQHPSNRRVVKLNGISTGRGRFAESTGPVNGPNLPASSTPSTPTAVPEWQRREQAKAAQEAEKQKKLQELAQQERVVGVELDEPYGGDIEEDAVEQRMTEIEQQRQQLQTPNPPRP